VKTDKTKELVMNQDQVLGVVAFVVVLGAFFWWLLTEPTTEEEVEKNLECRVKAIEEKIAEASKPKA
jgi:hypothetical protein